MKRLPGRCYAEALYGRRRNRGATKQQRNNFEPIARGIGIHREDLDEDLSVEGILNGGKDMTSR
ncbi:MAG: DUF2442 domain-containing protein [Chitinivibrionales bacterium]|nr:DUF2442 domain-containing protein [Chitinivibrionales bacterium]